MSGGRSVRADAARKIAGREQFVADMFPPDVCEIVLVRSLFPHARLTRIRCDEATRVDGVLAVMSGRDIGLRLWGRQVFDVPSLAVDVVRYIGEPIAAVIAESRGAAERGAQAVEIDYEPIDSVFDPFDALDSSSAAVHESAWTYRGSGSPIGSHNVQSRIVFGDREAAERELRGAHFAVSHDYRTPRGHHGYIEPQACVADARPDGTVHLWVTNKQPHRLRSQLSVCLGLDPDTIVVEPIAIGGDFGGKGSALLAPICVLASQRVGRPVRLILPYNEDLIATNPRHGSIIKVQIGCDEHGKFAALSVEAVFDGGAYAGCKAMPNIGLPGMMEAGTAYAFPAYSVESTIAYTNSVPGGHMRSPGAPQVTFAIESAVDELALAAGLSPVEIRRLNLLRDGQPNPHGIIWAECRGGELLAAALAADEPLAAPNGWRRGRGIAVYDREIVPSETTIRLSRHDSGVFLAEVPFPETGTGSHEAVRNTLAEALGVDAESVEVRQGGTDDFPMDPGVGGSWLTASAMAAADAVVERWRHGDGSEVVATATSSGPGLTSFVVQIAQVAVDPVSGAYRVLGISTAVDVARVVNEMAHQMQIDGGAAMGFGFGTLEDLAVEEGQVWAGTMGEFRIPTAEDVPAWKTVLLRDGIGMTVGGVKPIGELSNVPTAAAIANAIADAVGVRVRSLPVTAERVWRELRTVS